jgi:DNA-binding FadR family transcriptional regulator
MAELVAAQLRQRIIAGDLGDGAELPRESDLLDTFAVSRPSLREALRILETEGLIRIRRGKLGGAVVRRPTAESAGYHLGLTLQSRGVTLSDLATARMAIQPMCATLAAERPEREAIAAELTGLIDESRRLIGQRDAFATSGQQFHARVAQLCGNTTMLLMAGTLEALWSSQALDPIRVQARERDPDEADDLARRSVTEHRRIVRHIARGAGDAAGREMRRHLAETQEAQITALGDAAFQIIPPLDAPAA